MHRRDHNSTAKQEKIDCKYCKLNFHNAGFLSFLDLVGPGKLNLMEICSLKLSEQNLGQKVLNVDEETPCLRESL